MTIMIFIKESSLAPLVDELKAMVSYLFFYGKFCLMVKLDKTSKKT